MTVAEAVRAKKTFDERNNKDFKVNEISYDASDDKDEISLSISNPESLPIYVKEGIILLSTNYDVLKKKINEKKIILNDLDYKITEVQPYGDDAIPTLIKIKIPGLSKIAKKVKPAKSPTLRAANILTSSPGGRITALLTGAVNMFSGKGVGQSAAGAATAGLGAAALSKIPLGPLNPAKGLLAFLAIPALNQAGMNAYDITKQYFTQNKLDFSGLNITSKLGGIQNIFTKEPDTSKAPDIVARPAAQISPSSQSDVSAQIGPEPQAQTQVVLTDATSDQQPQEVPTTTGNVTDLPAVMSSNLDNFYLLYSQVQYNVVI